MRTPTLCLSIMIMFMSTMSKGQPEGKITPALLEKIKAFHNNDISSKAITNMVSNNDIKNLALNRENIGKTDHLFQYKVNVNGITNQKKSGRCWMFTGLNILRPKVMAKFNLEEFEFSTNYLYFWDIFEKSNLFLENVISTSNDEMTDRKMEWLFKNVVDDGGAWTSFANIVGKYGVMPKKAMPETANSEDTYNIIKFINTKLRGDGLILRKMTEEKAGIQKIREKKIEMLGEVYHMLAISLGEPPVEFSWRYKDKDGKLSETKNYTPKSFYDEILGINLDDYILFMDDPTRPYYKLYEIEYDRNIVEGRNWFYINLPAAEIKPFAKASIINNEAMYFSCDVGKQLNKEEGLLSIDNYDYNALWGVNFSMNKKERILTYESGSSHAMTLVGVDTDNNGNITKWLLENSWGKDSGQNGYITMTDEWFDEYMFRLVVPKKFIDKKTLDILKQEPTLLPPWDPMFMFDN